MVHVKIFKSRIFRMLALLAIAFHSGIPFTSHAAKSATKKPRGPSLTLFGAVPGEYVGADPTRYSTAVISIENGIIHSVQPAKTPPSDAFKIKDNHVIYPGLFNLHNHTKQNVLGVWDRARGQFQNRFEWRKLPPYRAAVSGNMNPWVGLGAPMTCATFRYSEWMSMALGTTYLQGPSSCVSGFAVNRVEDKDAFPNQKNLQAVQAPTDLVYPNEMTFIWEEVMPRMQKLAGVTSVDALLEKLDESPESSTKFGYEAGLQAVIKDYCPLMVKTYPQLNLPDPVLVTSLPDLDDWFKIEDDALKGTPEHAKSVLGCKTLPDQMKRWMTFIHSSITGKKKYLASKNYSGMVAHLAEGRRLDPYNQLEFKLLRILGLDRARVNLVHAVGVDEAGFKHMAKKGMGLVWSPFSNHLLYGESVDLKAAIQSTGGRLPIALGSDWTPTGSRSTLEEVKLARQYLVRNKQEKIFVDPLGKPQTMDQALYAMMTSNPARMLGHEGEAGTIAPGAAASLIVVSQSDPNPYTNLVYKTDESKINLVIVDGSVRYGNLSYIEQAASLGITQKLPPGQKYEELGLYFNSIDKLEASAIPLDRGIWSKLIAAKDKGEDEEEDENDEDDGDDQDDTEAAEKKRDIKETAGKVPKATKQEKLTLLSQLASFVSQGLTSGRLQPTEPSSKGCTFDEKKVVAPVNSLAENGLDEFHKETGLNLDRVKDTAALLHMSVVYLSRNRAASEGSKDFKAKAAGLSPIYSCEDPEYLARIGGNGTDPTQLFTNYITEIENNAKNRSDLRKELSNNAAQKMAEDYGLPFSLR